MRQFIVVLICLGQMGFMLNAQTPKQAELIGNVTLQVTLENQQTDAFPAFVYSLDGAATQKIKSGDGAFKLLFDQKTVGQWVRIGVEKAGYEVVNRKSLRVILPENAAEQRPLHLYLCPKGQVDSFAAKYYKINFDNIVKKQEQKLQALRKQFSDAKITQQVFDQQVDELNRDQTILEESTARLAVLFATADFSEQSARFRKAASYFAAGQLDSVLTALNEKEMLADLEAAKKQIADGQQLDSMATAIIEKAKQVLDTVQLLMDFLRQYEASYTLDIAGQLRDGENARPLSGAYVILADGSENCKTDSRGSFNLSLRIPEQARRIRLMVHAEGYQSNLFEIPVTGKKKLKPKIQLYKN